MKSRRLAALLGFAASLSALAAGAAWAADAAAPLRPAAPAQTRAINPAVDRGALEALNKMSAYLRTLPTFQVTSQTVREVVDDSDQKLQLLGSTSYKVKRPDSFIIEIAEDRKVRQVFYDGKTLTLFSPRMGYYASVPAPPTIAGVLKLAADKYDISVPLEDLFVWGTDADWRGDLTYGYVVGYSRVAGQDADQYAFRQKGVDWQIWIARGDKPVPLRVVITAADDAARPQFESSLTWDTAPQFAANTFAFTPPAGATPIVIKSASN
jgi:hypothetical protein